MSPRDGTAARIAARQRGLITARQLREAGWDGRTVRRAVAAKRLYRVHRGVYAVGHPGLTTEARYLAATLAGGPEAYLSHEAAAHLLGLTSGDPPPPVLTIRTNRSVDDLDVHRSRNLHVLDVSTYEGIPVTTVPRTLVDLAGTLDLGPLARACHQAWVRHRTSPELVLASLARTPNRPGAAKLRQALLGDELLLSALEEGFVELLRDAGLALPQTNVRRAEGRVDCHWPQLGLSVELDSYRYHASRQGWEDDVRRTRRSQDRHLRFTWGDVFERPRETLAELAPLLTAGRTGGPAAGGAAPTRSPRWRGRARA